jgi:hypothetical protein
MESALTRWIASKLRIMDPPASAAPLIRPPLSGMRSSCDTRARATVPRLRLDLAARTTSSLASSLLIFGVSHPARVRRTAPLRGTFMREAVAVGFPDSPFPADQKSVSWTSPPSRRGWARRRDRGQVPGRQTTRR